MGLFKSRLIELIAAILTVIIMLGIALIIIGVIKLLALIHPVVPAIIILTLIGGYLLVNVVVFVNWLFVEPFRKKKDNAK